MGKGLNRRVSKKTYRRPAHTGGPPNAGEDAEKGEARPCGWERKLGGRAGKQHGGSSESRN